MNDYSVILSQNIAKLRKEKGLTQGALAKHLNVSFQAISKWENKQSSPDVLLLPKLAEIFGVTIDELFGKARVVNIKGAHSALFKSGRYIEVDWNDDENIHAAVFIGHKLLKIDEDIKKFTFKLEGDALNVDARCNLEVDGNVTGSATAGGTITCGAVGCDANARGTIGTINCGAIGCDANANGSINCLSIGNDANAIGDINCGNISGDVNTAYGNVECNDVYGNVTCGGDIKLVSVKGKINPDES